MAQDWDKYKNYIEIGEEAEKNKKEIIFLHSDSNNYQNEKIFKTNDALKNYLEDLSPLPQQFKKGSLEKIKQDKGNFKNSKIFIVTSEFDYYKHTDYIKDLRFVENYYNNYYFINPVETILIINNLKIDQDKILLEISRLGENNFEQNFFINIETINKDVIYFNNHSIEENKDNLLINLNFPNEIINQIKMLEIVGQKHAGSKYYFDDFSKKKNIAILTDNEFYKESPLLSPIYYIKKSLDSKH